MNKIFTIYKVGVKEAEEIMKNENLPHTMTMKNYLSE